ncbi:predicted protein [Sclerotinia sclerotiorum 1980 UF-70]|uniref:Uncharacterized protein n=1 Tax=Sclerotinia sclerotiorum (strain ATCC 18683 / 1980 / Ss-1) TaxID=665079 RepID=A7EQ32_SCLS1|nr:predicted protein [Sclerotinia sclerotiorum 1980 UF-70]EDO04948.1 predicted protein [Sclerotinia sclerotiorum 1980 UF-70]
MAAKQKVHTSDQLSLEHSYTATISDRNSKSDSRRDIRESRSFRNRRSDIPFYYFDETEFPIKKCVSPFAKTDSDTVQYCCTALLPICDPLISLYFPSRQGQLYQAFQEVPQYPPADELP